MAAYSNVTATAKPEQGRPLAFSPTLGPDGEQPMDFLRVREELERQWKWTTGRELRSREEDLTLVPRIVAEEIRPVYALSVPYPSPAIQALRKPFILTKLGISAGAAGVLSIGTLSMTALSLFTGGFIHPLFWMAPFFGSAGVLVSNLLQIRTILR